MKNDMKIIILAGGAGKRLWPISSKEYPKQFLKIFDNESLFQKTILRFEKFDYLDEIVVVINEDHLKIIRDQIAEIGFEKKVKILIEPKRKNTAPAILFAIKSLKESKQIDEKTNLLILPSDHLIFPKEKFLSYLENLKKQVLDKIVIFGIRPSRIETGYGHIEIGKNIEGQNKDNLYEVKKFIEKPEFKIAKKLFLSEKYLWNAGMFLFTEKVIFNELKKCNLDLHKFYQMSFDKFLKNFSKIPKISIDYALIEKTKNISVCPIDVSWSDVGSWDSIYDVMQKDDNANVTKGNVLTLNTKNSLIFAKKKLISTMGLENIILVETDDAIFLAKKGESQKIKDLIDKMLKKKSKGSF